MLNLDWAAVRDAAPPRCSHQVRVAFSDPFCECQGHCSHWHLSSVMRCLWATLYGRQKRAKSSQRVHVSTYRRPWRTTFWSAFSFGQKKLQTWSKKCLRIGVWQFASCANGSLNLATWRESSMTRYTKNATAHAKIHWLKRWLRRKIAECSPFPSI